MPVKVAPLSLVEYVPVAARRVLDCACGDGARGRALKERGTVFVAGIEADETNAEDAAKALDQVVHGTLEDAALPFDDGAFDCILCDGVLATLRDPAPPLMRLAALLAPEGLLIATVPNIQYYGTVRMLLEGRWDYTDEGILSRRHLRFFTAFEMVNLLRNSGFEAKKCGALVQDDPALLPLDQDGSITLGNATIGPLSKNEHKAYLTQHYILFAIRT